MKARAEWHFGGGPQYCSSCAAAGLPCTEGRPGLDGQRCPYDEHAPQTVEGWQVWDLAMSCAGQLRVAPSGVVMGFDQSAVLAIAAAHDMSVAVMVVLLPAIEAAMVEAASMNDDAKLL